MSEETPEIEPTEEEPKPRRRRRAKAKPASEDASCAETGAGITD